MDGASTLPADPLEHLVDIERLRYLRDAEPLRKLRALLHAVTVVLIAFSRAEPECGESSPPWLLFWLIPASGYLATGYW